MTPTIDKTLLARYGLRETLGLVIMGLALFWPAGTLAWWQAWAALAVMAAWVLATAYIGIRLHPGLLAERLGPRAGTARWDLVVMSLLGLIQLLRYIVAGFDFRDGVDGGIDTDTQVMALLVCMFGYGLVVWATAVNAFFSQMVRVQGEHGQQVVSRGPYQLIRHPGYLGSLLFEVAVPVLLGSWWALSISLVNVALLMLRTAWEDRLLQQALAGYADYAARVRYRLLPGVW